MSFEVTWFYISVKFQKYLWKFTLIFLEGESNGFKWMAIQGNLILFNENRLYLRVNHDSFPNYFFLTHLINSHGCQILQIFGDDFVNL